jgi:hypothetical protein
MNTNTHQAISALESMRLPELQARYLEVLGESTRCPNRGFLVRKISEALVVSDARSKAPQAKATTSESVVEPETAELSRSSLSEPRAPTDDELRAPESDPDRESASSADDAPCRPRGRFRGMTIEELQHKYLEVVGRPSRSEHKGYLIWKIREAEKGHVPIGPVQGRERAHEPADIKVLPLRIESAALAHIDGVWRKHGFGNRTTFLRSAIEHYLTHLDSAEVSAWTEA